MSEADKTDASNELWFECMGIPVPQGSTRGFYAKKLKRVIITHEHGGELRNGTRRRLNEERIWQQKGNDIDEKRTREIGEGSWTFSLGGFRVMRS